MPDVAEEEDADQAVSLFRSLFRRGRLVADGAAVGAAVDGEGEAEAGAAAAVVVVLEDSVVAAGSVVAAVGRAGRGKRKEGEGSEDARGL